MNKYPVWIDTDTGVDDAIALLTAFKLDKLEVVGISAVCGNTTHENAFRNARNVTYLAGQDIKVYPGSERPLVKPLKTAVQAHGENGLGGAIIDDSPVEKETKKAWDAMYEKAKELNGELIIIAVGPLTNVAIAIAKHPDFVDYIKEINIMGGCADGGNSTPCAEFNIYTDPHAAENVFKSGVHVNMFGLDVTLKALLTVEQGNEIGSLGNKAGELFKNSTGMMYHLCEAHIQPGLVLHDCCPVVYVQYPELFKGVDCGVYVETQGTISMGRTCTDIWTDFKYDDRHCTVFLDVDTEKFAKLVMDIYKSY